MPVPVQFDSVSEGRARFKELLDAAASGVPTRLTREQRTFALVDAARLRDALAGLSRGPDLVAEADGWSIMIPGTPVAADGSTMAEAVVEAIDALREYAADWSVRLSTAPNHAGNWALVQLTALSTDEQLTAWFTAGVPAPAA